MTKINGVLSDHVQTVLRRSIRGQEALESVRRMVDAIDSGQVQVVDAEMFAPPAVAGERTFAFKFHLKAVG
jgi:hypothetical protein